MNMEITASVSAIIICVEIICLQSSYKYKRNIDLRREKNVLIAYICVTNIFSTVKYIKKCTSQK